MVSFANLRGSTWLLFVSLVISSTLSTDTDQATDCSTGNTDCFSCAKMTGCVWCSDQDHSGPRCSAVDDAPCSENGKIMKDFHGSVQVSNPRGRNSRARRVYSFAMAKGDSKTISIPVTVPDGSNQLLLRISNRAGLRSQILTTNCTYSGNRRRRRLKNTVDCTSLTAGASMTIDLNIRMSECRGQSRASLKLFNRERRGSLAVINVSKFCSCGCESEVEESSDRCSNQGALVCGQCQCDTGFTGPSCQCLAGRADSAQCVHSSSDSLLPCSGRGECVCGQCECSSNRYSGAFCQCDSQSCPVVDGELCAGHGECMCGQCSCYDGYVGQDCACSTSMETCRGSNGDVCNNQGNCECGQCVCDPESPYTGPTCEDCPTCVPPCERFRQCVLCTAFPSDNRDCGRDQCIGALVGVVGPTTIARSAASECMIVDEMDGCTVKFKYDMFEDGQSEILIDNVKECPTTPAPMPTETTNVGITNEEEEEDSWWWP